MAVCEKVTGVRQARGNVIIRELTDLSTLSRTDESFQRLEILLIDYLACTLGAIKKRGSMSSRLFDDGIIGKGAWLALRSSEGDRDDIDWTVGTHPGSVIWSTVFSVGLHNERSRENFVEAALAGYRTGASIARFLGVEHRSKWHVTGTAGAFAAASAASVASGYSDAQHERALRLAGANIGASPVAPRERNGAASFNRSAAATLGTTAAMASFEGAIAVENLWDGPNGLLAMFSTSQIPDDPNLTVDGVSTTSLRLFPISGFAQSAVLATTLLAGRNPSELESIEVHIPEEAFSWLDGTRGDFWWDVKAAVAAAWFSKNPTILHPTDLLLDRIKIIPSRLPVGAAQVSVRSSTDSDVATISNPPGINFDDPSEMEWMNTKWKALLGDQLAEVLDISKDLMTSSESPELWRYLKSLLEN